MTATMACRGPDDEGICLSPHGALGHRRLAVIDIAGGRQPMVATRDDQASAVVTFSGEIYNFQELHEELGARGHDFRTRSDTEVLLHTYLEWGREFPAHLNGMYALGIWDPRTEELLLVRDRLGIKPLYYSPTPDGVLFGSEPKAILANPLAQPPVVGADGLRDLLSFVKSPGSGVFEGMHEVRPGSIVRVNRSGRTEGLYWRLASHEHPDDLPTTIRTVRGLLDDITERQLVSDVPLCTLLSGGLDSSALTAIAAKAMREHGQGSLRSFAVDFVGYTENFSPDQMRDTPDAPYVRDLVQHLGVDHSDIVLDSAELLDPQVRAAVLRARDLPTSVGDLDYSLYLLFKAIRSYSTVALSGESADEVFGGYRWFHDAEAVHADTFPWLTMLGRHVRLAEVLDQDLRAKLDIPGYVGHLYHEAIDEVPRLPGESGLEARMREINYFHLTRFVQLLLDRKDRMSMAVGLEVRVPFCDHRLVEYVFNTPWAMKTFDGREKGLLRAASADLLPTSVLERRKSPYPSTQDPGYERQLRDEAAQLLDSGHAPVTRILDLTKVRAMLDQPQGTVTRRDVRSALEGLLQFNAWLKRYDVQLSV